MPIARIRTGSEWTPAKSVRVSQDGSTWTIVKSIRRWSGSAWDIIHARSFTLTMVAGQNGAWVGYQRFNFGTLTPADVEGRIVLRIHDITNINAFTVQFLGTDPSPFTSITINGHTYIFSAATLVGTEYRWSGIAGLSSGNTYSVIFI